MNVTVIDAFVLETTHTPIVSTTTTTTLTTLTIGKVVDEPTRPIRTLLQRVRPRRYCSWNVPLHAQKSFDSSKADNIHINQSLSSRRRLIFDTISKSSLVAIGIDFGLIIQPSLAKDASLSSLTITQDDTTATAAVTNKNENDDDDNVGTGVSISQLVELLHAVPTYTIVDNAGVPYMVVGEDAKITGYFFVRYSEAKRILQAAIDATDRSIREAREQGFDLEPYQLINPWKSARISTVSLDTAVSLVTKSNTKQVGRGNYYQIAASQSDIDTALAITGKSSLAEGKVPLFYYKDFTLRKTGQSPLYFSQSQLEQAYKKEYPRNKSLPDEVNVTELFAVLSEMVRNQRTDNDDDLTTIVFIPPLSSPKDVQICEKQSNGQPPFVLGKRNIIL
jgi:Tic22-like family